MLHAGEVGTDEVALADPFGLTSCDACDHKGLYLRDTRAPFSQLAKCTKRSAEFSCPADKSRRCRWEIMAFHKQERETLGSSSSCSPFYPPVSSQTGRPLPQAPSQPWCCSCISSPSCAPSHSALCVSRATCLRSQQVAGEKVHPWCAGAPDTCWSTPSNAGRNGLGKALLLLPQNADFLTLA